MKIPVPMLIDGVMTFRVQLLLADSEQSQWEDVSLPSGGNWPAVEYCKAEAGQTSSCTAKCASDNAARAVAR